MRACTLVAAILALSCQPQPSRARPPEKSSKMPEADEREGWVVEVKAPAPGAAGPVTAARYEKVKLDPILEEMRERDEEWVEAQSEETGKIVDANKARKEKERKEELVLRSSLPEDQRPTSLDQFEKVWHNPPVAQYMTGTCWAFCTTSFMESEAQRISGKEVKLSEMATVYWEYIEKAKGRVGTRGDSIFAEGSQANALLRAFEEHGAWPADSYPGVVWKDGRHDHQRMLREMEAVIGLWDSAGIWDEPTAVSMIRTILDRDMGRPPEQVEFENTPMAPTAFLADVCRIAPDDYVSFISTLEFPFWTQAEYKAPDNWWHDASYRNVPLDDFYGALKSAIDRGYSAVVALDVSEPGKDPENDVMFVPDYDIPSDRIDQLAREYRFASGVTTDDHGVHLVGWTSHAGHDWFLAKDSGRASRHGKVEGYFFIRDDYVRLKVLSFTVHREAVADLLAKWGSVPYS